MCVFRKLSLVVGGVQGLVARMKGCTYPARAPHGRRPLCFQGAGQTLGSEETWKADRGSCAVEIPGAPARPTGSALCPARACQAGGQRGHRSRDLAPTTEAGALATSPGLMFLRESRQVLFQDSPFTGSRQLIISYLTK